MNKDELFKVLIKELMELDEVHYEYTDNSHTYVLDSTKDGGNLTINVSLKENKDKQDFEDWLSKVDNDLFQEVLEELGEPSNLDKLYDSDNYKEAIHKVKSKTKELALKKIKELQEIINN